MPPTLEVEIGDRERDDPDAGRSDSLDHVCPYGRIDGTQTYAVSRGNRNVVGPPAHRFREFQEGEHIRIELLVGVHVHAHSPPFRDREQPLQGPARIGRVMWAPTDEVDAEIDCLFDDLVAHGTVAPHVNQILVHAGNTPSDLIRYCQDRDILVEAYSPIAHGEILGNPRVKAIADRYGVSVPQLCIRYTLQLGTVSLPKTANPEHMRANADVDFVIGEEDMQALLDLDERDYGRSSVFPVYGGR